MLYFSVFTTFVTTGLSFANFACFEVSMSSDEAASSEAQSSSVMPLIESDLSDSTSISSQFSYDEIAAVYTRLDELEARVRRSDCMLFCRAIAQFLECNEISFLDEVILKNLRETHGDESVVHYVLDEGAFPETLKSLEKRCFALRMYFRFFLRVSSCLNFCSFR